MNNTFFGILFPQNVNIFCSNIWFMNLFFVNFDTMNFALWRYFSWERRSKEKIQVIFYENEREKNDHGGGGAEVP